MIQLTDNLEINKPAPVDDRLGVFESTAEALAYTNEDRRYVGLTVIIDSGSGATEYWFKDGVTDADLEVKASGGGGQVNADWNATSGVAEILNKPTIPSIDGLVPYTGATEDIDLGTHDLYTNKVYLLDESNGNHGSIHYTDGDFHIEDADGHKLLVIEDGFMQLHLTDTIQSNIFTSNLTQTRDHYLPNASGTIALTSDITKSAVGLGNVDNTSDANKPVSTATQTALDAKAPIASPTFTGTVGGVTKSMVGLGSVDNTTDLGKPISTATQTALDAKAPIASPTFTGTVGGITKSMVGLGNVDNTTDLNKPISTATQTALNNRSYSVGTSGSSSITIVTGGVANLIAISGHTFTIPETDFPIGATIQINGMSERVSGAASANGGLSVDINGSKRYWILTGTGTQWQYQFTLYRESATSIRMMGGGSAQIQQGSFGSINTTSTTATVTAGGNVVCALSGWGTTAGDVIAYRFFKAILTR
jgi:hypothetical protein